MSSYFPALTATNECQFSKLSYVSAATAILALVLFTIRPTFAATGLVYDAVITTNEQGSNSVAQFVVTVWAAGPNLKADLFESEGKAIILKSSLLSADGGLTIVLIDPVRKIYSKIDPSSIGGKVAALQDLLIASTPKSEEKVTKVIDESGGRLLGFPVHHYQFRREFSRPDKNKPARRTTAEMLDDVWVTTALTSLGIAGPSEQSILAQFVSQFAPLNLPDGTEVRGFQLRRKSVLSFPAPDGSQHTVQMQMEVRRVKRTNLVDSTFRIPADFKEVDFRKLALTPSY